MLRVDGFRMKLHAYHRVFAVTHRHDLAVVRLRQHFQTVRKSFLQNRKGMIACHLDRAVNIGEDAVALVVDQRLLAMIQLLRVADGRA